MHGMKAYNIYNNIVLALYLYIASGFINIVLVIRDQDHIHSMLPVLYRFQDR